MKEQRISREWYLFAQEALEIWKGLTKSTSPSRNLKFSFQNSKQNPITVCLKVSVI